MSDKGSKGTIAEPILNPDELFTLLVACVRAKYPVLVTGAPGIGKTSIIQQVAAYLGCGLQISHAVVDSPLDYKGHPYAWMEQEEPVCDTTKEAFSSRARSHPKATFIPYGDLEKLIKADRLMIHFADDLGQASDIVKAAYMQLQLGRKINGHKVSDDVVFLAATNRKEDAAGVTRFLEPLKDRYHTIVQLKTDSKQWVAWAQKNDLAHEVWGWIRQSPQFLDGFKPTSDFSRTPTPRAVHQLSDMHRLNFPPEMQLRIFSGIIGEEAAVSFVTHLKYYAKLQDPDLVLADPMKADVPDDPALLYALCGSLVPRANKKTIGAIVKFAGRLEDSGFAEFGVLLVKDASMRNPKDLMSSMEFIEWATAHKEQISL